MRQSLWRPWAGKLPPSRMTRRDMLDEIADPRTFESAAAASVGARALHALSEHSLTAESGQHSAVIDGDIEAALATLLVSDAAALAELFATVPSVDVARHLWRLLDSVWRS